MLLLSKIGVPLFIRDIFNPEKQDDGAARRLFLDTLFDFLVDSDGNIIDVTFEGFFVLTFIFGELFDAYMKHGMSHIERLTAVFRARHFLNIWRINVFILLLLAHLEYYPNVPFFPRKHGSSFIEHYFGITLSFISEFAFGQLIQMNKHITFWQRIFSSGKYNSTKEKYSNNGYIHDCDSPLTTEEITALKKIPSRPGFDRALVVGSKEADMIATQFCGMELPKLLLKRRARISTRTSASDGSDDEEPFPVTAKDIDFELDTPIRIPPHPNQDAVCPESDAIVLGKDLTVSQALAHAAHHIVTERVLSELVAKDEAELDAIDKELDANPETSVSGRMWIAPLLNPAPPTPAAILVIPTFLKADGTISRQDLVDQRRCHCATTREKTRKPEINAEYLGGKFSLNHAAHQLKEGLQSEGLRKDTTFQKARYRRWIVSGPAVEWTERCRLDVALSNLHVPKLRSRGVDAITPIRLGSLVIMRSAIRLYLGEVLGIYRYGSVSGKHESYTDTETVDGLSYLSLRMYEQIGTSLNLFRHIVPVHRGVSALALFNHAPISELVYPLTCGSLSTQPNAMFSIPGGDSGYECWDALSSSAAVYRILDLPADNSTDDSEEEDDYDEPISGSSSKK
ncbi:hypothetical protein B0H17DRAFT_1218096 [Mycena rosella]|uniref:Uncharacterized protein n=1 Tax=Mycena rosella TaxID=1033263 RepID=A0AAD7FKG9_MYCRO|nr:hypothetical protein B0H17DRAFT_1218096 [Mycena rosella]